MSQLTVEFRMECPSKSMMALPPMHWQKSSSPTSVSLPLPMHGLTLCGFERSTRPTSVPLLNVRDTSMSPNSSEYIPLCGKRSRDYDNGVCEKNFTPSSTRAQSHASSSSSEAESENEARADAARDHSSQLQVLQHENADLQKRIQASDEELKKLREIVGQLFEVEKTTQKRPATKEESKPQRRYWNNDEHERFLTALQRHGPKDVKAIANFVGTRNPTQVRTHAQKYFQKVARAGGCSSFPEESCSGEDNSSSPGSPCDNHM